MLRRCLYVARTFKQTRRPSIISIHHGHRGFSISAAAAAKPMPPRPSVKEDELEEAFLRGSGPGGQKINKTSCAVQLKHIPTGIVVKSQETRSRSQNRKIARRLLAAKLEVIEKGPESRTAVLAEVKKRKKASKNKKAKRKYKKLEGEQAGNAAAEGTDENDEEEGESDGIAPGDGRVSNAGTNDSYER